MQACVCVCVCVCVCMCVCVCSLCGTSPSTLIREVVWPISVSDWDGVRVCTHMCVCVCAYV